MVGCRPLSDEEIKAVLHKLIRRPRDAALFLLGVKSGFRISELLSLRVKDVYQYGKIAERVSVERRFMKKKRAGRTIFLHPEARSALSELIQGTNLKSDDFLFHSRKGSNKPIGRIQAWRVIKEAMIESKLEGKVATHSMRKTFASKIYDLLGRDLVKTQAALGHKSITSTVSYLSFEQAEIDKAILSI